MTNTGTLLNPEAYNKTPSDTHTETHYDEHRDIDTHTHNHINRHSHLEYAYIDIFPPTTILLHNPVNFREHPTL